MNTNTQALAIALARTRALALAAAILGGALPASAAVTVYTDPTAYQAALLGASVATDDFSDLTPDSALAGPLARFAGSTAYSVRAVPLVSELGAEDFFPVAPGGNTALSSNFAEASQLFDQFSQALSGVSGQFFSSDVLGSPLAGTLNLVLVDQDGSFNYSLASGNAPSFLGFISTGSISSLSLSAVQPLDEFRYAVVDDLGLAVASAVPEPGAVWLGLWGLGLLGLMARRKRAQ